MSAALHGKDLLALDFTVEQVVHDYGDLCQAITDLAIDRDAPFQIDEYRTLNRCLDNAIADAVSEFSYQRDFIVAGKHEAHANERIEQLSHELRNLLGTATLAFSAAKAGSLSFSGATGTILERSLAGLAKLIDNSLDDVRELSRHTIALSAFSLDEFIAEVKGAAELSVADKGCLFTVLPVDPALALCGNRELLLGAVTNLLQNAFKFTHLHTEVTLTAYAAADRILIDVKDHCGGLPPNLAATIFLPFSQAGADRTGVGLGLTIARQAVIANGGELSILDIPGVGCVFTMNLPRHEVPT
jgi:signal transduction histidine kinase